MKKRIALGLATAILTIMATFVFAQMNETEAHKSASQRGYLWMD